MSACWVHEYTEMKVSSMTRGEGGGQDVEMGSSYSTVKTCKKLTQ